jgi:hypothetical protein
MLTRRAAFSLLGGFALAPAATLAQPGPRFRAIQINVDALRTDRGEDTANWVASALPAALAQSLGAYYQPGDRNGAVLTARIDTLFLGPNSGTGAWGSSQDEIAGVLIVHGPRGVVPGETPLRATTSYFQSPVDQPLRVESNHTRIVTLAQAFAGWAPRELGL